MLPLHGSPAAVNVSLHHTGVYQRHIHERTGGCGRVARMAKAWKRGKRMWAVLGEAAAAASAGLNPAPS
jgi:hypothetical protein